MFAFHFLQSQYVSAKNSTQAKQFVDIGPKSSLTYRVQPLQRNKILARFENIADNFDANSSSPIYFNVRKFAKEFYIEAN